MNEVQRIVFASVLKPCDDIRSYGRLAKALVIGKKTKVTMIGKKTPLSEIREDVLEFKPIFDFHRLSLRRLFSEFILFKELIRTKPHTIIISTYELLLAGGIYKWLAGARLIYDVQENYMLNVKTGTLKSKWLKSILAFYVRQKEKALSHAVDHFLLAEGCYVDELPFIGNRFSIIENKVDENVLHFLKTKPKSGLNICITGTLGKTYGTIEGIMAAQQLKSEIPELKLTIAGYCADEAYLQELNNLIHGLQFIKMLGGKEHVPHSQILKVIADSHITFMFYERNESFVNKIPTKFYECIALNTLIVSSLNLKWSNFLSLYDAGICIDVNQIDAKSIERCLQMPIFKDENIFFKEEKQKLLAIVYDQQIFK